MIIETKEITRIILPRLLTLVTCDDGISGIDALPVDTLIPLSSSPSTIVITINPTFKIFQNILSQEEFAINILPREFAKKIMECAKNYPRGINKLEQVGLNHYSSQKIKAKRVKEAKVWIECKLVNKMKVGENMLLFGEVVSIEVDDGIMTGGKIDVTKLNPPLRISESNFSEIKGELK